MLEKTTLYRKIFCDVSRGYSRVTLDESYVFIRHLTTHDQVDLEDIEKEFFNKAKERGLPEEKEALDSLIKDGTWTKEDDSFIDSQNLYIENLIRAKGQLLLKSQIDERDKLIQEEQKKLNNKVAEKDSLLGSTCEKYAKQRINDH